MTRRCSRSSMWISFSVSPSRRRETGIPVQEPTTALDVVLVDLLLDHRVGRRLALGELLLERGQLAVADLGDSLEVARALGRSASIRSVVDPLDLADPVESALLLGPARGEPSRRSFASASARSTGSGRRTTPCPSRRELDLELADRAVGLVELERQLSISIFSLRGGLVDQVDRLVGQLAVGDVAVGEHGRGDERGVARSGRRGAPRSVSFSPRRIAIVSPTLGSPTKTGWNRRSSAASFSMCLRYSSSVVAPTQRSSPRASIGFSRFAASTAPSAAPAPTIVCSSSMKRTIRPSAFATSGEHRLQPLLELAAVLRAREERADVERQDALVLQALGHVAGDDALREPLGDRRLADAGLADQDRVVLRAPREHLDHAADLVVAADHGIELPALRGLGEVAPVLA